MPNALILGYQKSRIRHTPSHLRPSERTTRSLRLELVFNTGHAVTRTAGEYLITRQARQAVVGCGFDENL
jgi:hypothetical protein